MNPPPNPNDYTAGTLWELVALCDDDCVARGLIATETQAAAPFSGTECHLCRWQITEADGKTEVGAVGSFPIYLLLAGKRFSLCAFDFEAEPTWEETSSAGIRQTEWRLDPGVEYRFRVREIYPLYDGVVGHRAEWEITCLGPAARHQH